MRVGVSSRALLIFTAAVVSASSQIRLSPGLIVGTPLTDTLTSSSSSSSDGTSFSFDRFHSETKRLLIGPSVTLELPHGLGLEFDALYQRVNSDSASASTTPGSYSYQDFEQTTANRWQFPFLLQYRHGIGKSKAFVKVGPSISTIAGAKTTDSSTTVSPPSAPSASTDTFTSPAATMAGITTGGGIAIPLLGHHFRAEIRFSHWFTGVGEYPTALERVGDFSQSFSVLTAEDPGTGSIVVSTPVSGGSSEHANEASVLLGFSF